MRVAFIDDDPNELKILHTYFNDLTDSSTISIDDFSSGEEFLSRFTAGLYDLVILDIFTGDLTGVDVAHLLFPELARQSYRWSFSFLLFLIEIILCIPLFFYIKNTIKI